MKRILYGLGFWMLSLLILCSGCERKKQGDPAKAGTTGEGGSEETEYVWLTESIPIKGYEGDELYLFTIDEKGIAHGRVFVWVSEEGENLEKPKVHEVDVDVHNGEIVSDWLVVEEGGREEIAEASASEEFLASIPWLDLGFLKENIWDCYQELDGSVYALIRDPEHDKMLIQRCYQVEASEVPPVAEVVLAVIDPDHSLEQAVLDFNFSQKAYHVSLQEWKEGKDEDREDAAARLGAALAAGEAADLIDLGDLDASALAGKGFLEDLSPYLKRGNVIREEDYEPQLLECGRREGILAFIPRGFTLLAKVVPEERYEKKDWTYADLVQYCRDNAPGEGLMIPWDALDTLLSSNLQYFVEFEKGECHFDSREFRELLELAKEYPMGTGLHSERILYLRSIQLIEEKLGGRANFVGYPSPDGVGKVYLEATGKLGMLKNAGQKEGAWAFLEFYLSRREEQGLFLFSLPANRKLMDQLVEEELSHRSEQIGSKGKNVSYLGRYCTKEEIDAFYGLLSRAEPIAEEDQAIYEILIQELPLYFDGQKGVEEVTEIIQNRASLYLKERQ